MAYVPPPTKSQKNSGSLKGATERSAYELLTQLFPELAGQLQFGQELMPHQQDMIRTLLNYFTPGGQNSLIQQQRSRLMGQGTGAGMRNAALLRSQGLSKGAQAGAIQDSRNRA